MQKSIKVLAYGKVNLSLNITGAAQSMHALDSVFCSVGIADSLQITLRSDNKINVDFTNADINKTANTALTAARLVYGLYPHFGADIIITKAIPQMGGMGGSSADAAGVFAGLNYLLNLPQYGVEPYSRALKAGSDVPFMICGGAGRVYGTGGDVFFFKNNAPLFILACSPPSGVSTAAAYAKFDELFPKKSLALTDNERLMYALMEGRSKDACAMFSNALFEPARALNPDITPLHEKLLSLNALTVNMTGSGSYLCAYYDDISAAHNDYERLLSQGIDAMFLNTVNNGVEFV